MRPNVPARALAPASVRVSVTICIPAIVGLAIPLTLRHARMAGGEGAQFGEGSGVAENDDVAVDVSACE